ncbi:MAG: DinB family protein [Vicinamibacterales bacterium]
MAALLDLLGNRNPLDVLTQTARVLDEALQGLSAKQLRQPEAEGKWSVTDVLQHLADSELVWGFRLRMTLAHERPPLMGYDQDLWASRLHYREADHQQALKQFTVLRESNLNLLKHASKADLQRVAVHAERGEQTLEKMVRLGAGHDLVHINQVTRIKASL